MSKFQYSIKMIRNKILLVTLKGEQNVENAAQAGKAVNALAKSKGIRLFLVDSRQVVVLDTVSESLNFMSNLDEIGFHKTDTIAVLYAHQDEKHLFAEDVGINRGFNIRYFTKKGEAMDWLLSESV